MLYPHSYRSLIQSPIFYPLSSLNPVNRKLTRMASYCFRYFGAIDFAREAIHSYAAFLTYIFGSERTPFIFWCTCSKLPPAPSVLKRLLIVIKIFFLTMNLR